MVWMKELREMLRARAGGYHDAEQMRIALLGIFERNEDLAQSLAARPTADQDLFWYLLLEERAIEELEAKLHARRKARQAATGAGAPPGTYFGGPKDGERVVLAAGGPAPDVLSAAAWALEGRYARSGNGYKWVAVRRRERPH